MDFEDLPQPDEPELASVTRPGLSSVTTNCNQNAVGNTVCFGSELELLLLHWHPAYNSNFLSAGGCRYKWALLYVKICPDIPPPPFYIKTTPSFLTAILMQQIAYIEQFFVYLLSDVSSQGRLKNPMVIRSAKELQEG